MSDTPTPSTRDIAHTGHAPRGNMCLLLLLVESKFERDVTSSELRVERQQIVTHEVCGSVCDQVADIEPHVLEWIGMMQGRM